MCVINGSITNFCSLILFPELYISILNSAAPGNVYSGLAKTFGMCGCFAALQSCSSSLMLKGQSYMYLTKMMRRALVWRERMIAQILCRQSLPRYSVPSLVLSSRSSGVGVASHQIIPMSTRLIWSRGYSATRLKRSVNLLFTVLRIDPSTLYSERHSSVTATIHRNKMWKFTNEQICAPSGVLMKVAQMERSGLAALLELAEGSGMIQLESALHGRVTEECLSLYNASVGEGDDGSWGARAPATSRWEAGVGGWRQSWCLSSPVYGENTCGQAREEEHNPLTTWWWLFGSPCGKNQLHHILPAPLQPARASVTHWSWQGNYTSSSHLVISMQRI